MFRFIRHWINRVQWKPNKRTPEWQINPWSKVEAQIEARRFYFKDNDSKNLQLNLKCSYLSLKKHIRNTSKIILKYTLHKMTARQNNFVPPARDSFSDRGCLEQFRELHTFRKCLEDRPSNETKMGSNHAYNLRDAGDSCPHRCLWRTCDVFVIAGYCYAYDALWG